MKCLTAGCENQEHQGIGVKMLAPDQPEGHRFLFICMPCWEFLTRMQGLSSQLYRNGLTAGKAAGHVVSVDGLGNALQSAFGEVMAVVQQDNDASVRAMADVRRKADLDRPCPLGRS